jgi:hypothetical protein
MSGLHRDKKGYEQLFWNLEGMRRLWKQTGGETGPEAGRLPKG